MPSSYKNLKQAFSLIELSVVVLIIGILIAGITAGSRLVRDSKLKSAAQLTKSSDVNSIADLVLQLEPTIENSFAFVDSSESDTTTLSNIATSSTYQKLANQNNINYIKDIARPNNRDLVARWNDINPKIINGNKKSVYQHNNLYRPMYIANAINNLPALYFTFQSSRMFAKKSTVTPEPAPLPFDNKTSTRFMVFTYDTIDGCGLLMAQNDMNTNDIISNTASSVVMNRASSKIYHGLANTEGIYESSNTLHTINPSTPTILVLKVKTAQDKQNQTISSYANSNSPITTKVSQNFSNFVVGDSFFGIGGENPQSKTYSCGYGGYIGEIIAFDRDLTQEEIETINKYLSKKWSIALK